MHSVSTFKRCLLVICLLTLVICGCAAASGRGALDMNRITSPGSAFQVSQMHMEFPAFLDEEQLTDTDAMLSHKRVHSRKMGAFGWFFLRPLLFLCLLRGMLSLFSYLLAGFFHDSTCPTYGLFRIIAFIFDSDGHKSYAFLSQYL